MNFFQLKRFSPSVIQLTTY